MNKTWLKAALVRAVKTICQTAVALIGTGAIGIFDVDWKMILSASVLAGIVSILTSIAGLPEVNSTAVLEKKPELPDDYFEEDTNE